MLHPVTPEEEHTLRELLGWIDDGCVDLRADIAYEADEYTRRSFAHTLRHKKRYRAALEALTGLPAIKAPRPRPFLPQPAPGPSSPA